MTKNKLFLTILSLIILLSSCRALFELPVTGTSAYDNKQYAQAAELLKEDYAAEKDLSIQSDIAYKIADSYRRSNQTEKAETWYQKAADYSDEPLVSYYYGLMLKSNGKYEKAMRVFKEYSLENPSDRSRATREMQACKQAIRWLADTTNFEVSPATSLNSKAADFAPVVYLNDQLVFTSSRESAKGSDIYGWTGEKHSDIFIASRQDDFSFVNPVQFADSINTAYNEGVVAFNREYTEMYFTACGSKSKDADDYCKLYVTTKNANGQWLEPERVVLFESEEINVGHPFIADDGNTLYFSADVPEEGFGDKDLYRVIKDEDGYWGEPENLGAGVNTEGYEGFPYINPEGQLFFASDGHIGMGGLDIFYATMKKGKWVEPQNLAAPINSSADDFGISFLPFVKPEYIDTIQSIAYFSSSRKGGMGNDDIYLLVEKIPLEPRIDIIAMLPKLEAPLFPEPEFIPDVSIQPTKAPKLVLEEEPTKPKVVEAPKPPPVKPPPPPKPVTPPPPPPVVIKQAPDPPPARIIVPDPEPVYVLKGKVLENIRSIAGDPNSNITGTNPIGEAAVEVLGTSANSTLVKRIITDSQGNFSTEVEKDSDYKLTATKNGFFTNSATVSTKNRKVPGQLTIEIYQEIRLDRIVKQKEITLNNIYYDLDKSNIREDAKPNLDELATLLFENPTIRIELGSHTDSRGSASYNQKLSQERAQSVVDYLASKGISSSRLMAIGYGEKQLVNRCKDGVTCSEEEHQENRRTTFKVID